MAVGRIRKTLEKSKKNQKNLEKSGNERNRKGNNFVTTGPIRIRPESSGNDTNGPAFAISLGKIFSFVPLLIKGLEVKRHLVLDLFLSIKSLALLGTFLRGFAAWQLVLDQSSHP